MIPRSLWKKNMAAEGCCLLWMMLSLTLFELFVLRSLRRLSLDKVGEPSIVFEDSSMFEPVLLEYKTTEANWLQSVVREGKVGSFTSQCYERLIFNPFEHHFFTQKVISRSICNLKIDTIYMYDIPFDRSFLRLSNGMTCYAIYWQKARINSKGIDGSARLTDVCVLQWVHT